jgi:hypothetical protein
MNAAVEKVSITSGTSADATFDFVEARSQLLDACFELEVAVSRWLRCLGEKDNARPLGQRLEQLATHRELGEMATAKQAKHIQSLPTICERLLSIRNASVHSRREFGFRGSEPCAFLSTLENAVGQGSNFFVVKLAEMDVQAKVALTNARQIANYLTQASSPPPPSPGAAGGP